MTGLPMPLTPVQLIWLNLVTNGAQDVMLCFGKGEGDELRRPPRPARGSIIDKSALALMIPPAVFMAAVALVMAFGAANSAPVVEKKPLVLFTLG